MSSALVDAKNYHRWNFDWIAPYVRGRVLDIGGARGDLMQRVVARRPDVHVTVHDISEAATSWAAAQFGFATLNGDADVLAGHAEQYDIVVLSDVLYYEPKLKLLWSALSRLMRPGGTLIIRVPNKVALVQLGRLWLHLSRSRERRLLQDRVPFFNPEQIFIFRRRYLLARLAQLGCSRIEVVPSPPLGGSIPAVVRSAAFGLASITSLVTRGTLVLTPTAFMNSGNFTVASGAMFNAQGTLLSTANVTANGPVNFGMPSSARG